MSILERRNYYGLKAISGLMKESLREFRESTSSVGIFTLQDGTEITTNIVPSSSCLFNEMNRLIPDIPNIAYAYSDMDGKVFVEVSGTILQFTLGRLINPPTYLINYTNAPNFLFRLMIQVGLTYQALFEKSIKRYVVNSISIHETYDEPYYIRIGEYKYKVSMGFIGLMSPIICNDVDTGNYYDPAAQMASDFVTFFNYYSGIEPRLPIVYKSPLDTLMEYRELNPEFKDVFDSTIEKIPLSPIDHIMGIQPVVIPAIQKYLFLNKPLPDNYLYCFKPTTDKETNLYYADILKTLPNTERMVHELTGYLPATKSRKFIIRGKSGLYYKRLKHYLQQFSAEETFEVPQSILFLWAEGSNPDLDNVKCYLKNRVDGHKSITQKYNLYVNMMRNFPKETRLYMAETHVLRQGGFTDMRMIPGKLYIVRPSEGYAGKGISVISNPRELASAYIKAKQFSKGMSVRHNRNIESSPVLISEYIEDIHLYEGKKFHLRIYFMASILFGKYKTFTWNNGEVFTALNRYARGSMDPSVTDTHGSSTFGDINLFINGLPKEQYRHIIKISELLTTILGQTIKLYSETENAFEVFAIDLLIRKNNVPVLMEVNSRVGYKFNTGAVYGVPFSDDFFQWINEKVLVPAIE